MCLDLVLECKQSFLFQTFKFYNLQENLLEVILVADFFKIIYKKTALLHQIPSLNEYNLTFKNVCTYLH